MSEDNTEVELALARLANASNDVNGPDETTFLLSIVVEERTRSMQLIKAALQWGSGYGWQRKAQEHLTEAGIKI